MLWDSCASFWKLRGGIVILARGIEFFKISIEYVANFMLKVQSLYEEDHKILAHGTTAVIFPKML